MSVICYRPFFSSSASRAGLSGVGRATLEQGLPLQTPLLGKVLAWLEQGSAVSRRPTKTRPTDAPSQCPLYDVGYLVDYLVV